MGDGNSNVSVLKGLPDYSSDAALAAEELFIGYPDALVQFASACCVIFMLIGIPGNLITIIALAKCKKVRNATAIFIINLSCSDLLFCCFVLPLAASTFWNQSWKHGKTLCRMFPYAKYALVAVSLFSVLSITLNRYVLISHPTQYVKIYTRRNIYLMIGSLWTFAFSAFLPMWFEVWGRFSLDIVTGSCTIIPDKSDNSPKKYLFIVAFVLPSLAIILCYARIWWIVRKTNKLARRPKMMASTEMKTLNMSTATITTKSLYQKRLRTLPCTCFIQTGAELSTSSDGFTPDPESRHSTPELAIQVLGNEPRNFRKSFIATMKWSTAPKPQLPSKKDKKLLTMIVAIMVGFFVCHLPITLAKTIFLENDPHPISNIIGYVLIYFTTCVNPVIYVVMSSEYRQAYKNLMKCGRCDYSMSRHK